MICATICVAIFLIIQSVEPLLDMKNGSDKYGPYDIITSESKICRGPKSVDQAVASVEFNKIGDSVIGSFFYNVTEAIKMTEMKILVYSVQNNKKNLMWNHKLTDPCKHFGVGSILSLHLQMKPENCVTKPGTYRFDMNYSETVQTFLGKSFFYGDYIFKVVSLSKKGNLGCIFIHQIFEKKV